MAKKKEDVTTAPELEEVVVEAPVEDFPNNGVVVTHHEDRRDSGTNWNESKALPSLDDQTIICLVGVRLSPLDWGLFRGMIQLGITIYACICYTKTTEK